MSRIVTIVLKIQTNAPDQFTCLLPFVCVDYNLFMRGSRPWCALALSLALIASSMAARRTPAQGPPPATGARILLVPRQVVSGEHATLAVLDVNGRLTPGVTVQFSNGDKLKTDATGRALFVAPLTSGVLFATIAGRAGRVATAVLTGEESASDSLVIRGVPRVASLSDRFELAGRGFCGDADANHVTIGGQDALVLASSPASLVVLPPEGTVPGVAQVQVSCAKRAS